MKSFSREIHAMPAIAKPASFAGMLYSHLSGWNDRYILIPENGLILVEGDWLEGNTIQWTVSKGDAYFPKGNCVIVNTLGQL